MFNDWLAVTHGAVGDSANLERVARLNYERNPKYLFARLDYAEGEAAIRVDQVAPRVGSKVEYEHDFGDLWEHTIVVKEVSDPGLPAGGLRRCVG